MSGKSVVPAALAAVPLAAVAGAVLMGKAVVDAVRGAIATGSYPGVEHCIENAPCLSLIGTIEGYAEVLQAGGFEVSMATHGLIAQRGAESMVIADTSDHLAIFAASEGQVDPRAAVSQLQQAYVLDALVQHFDLAGPANLQDGVVRLDLRETSVSSDRSPAEILLHNDGTISLEIPTEGSLDECDAVRVSIEEEILVAIHHRRRAAVRDDRISQHEHIRLEP